MKSTKNDGIVAESIVPQINGHASADPFSAPSGAWAAGTGVQDDREASEDAAVWIPDVMLADHLDAASGDVISEVVDEDVWQAFRGFKNRYNIAITRETVFGEIGVVPAGIAHACGLEPTIADVAEFIDNYGYPLPDPCVEGDRLEAERFRRFHERDAVARELKPQGIAPDTEYSLSEVERVCGAQVAEKARLAIEQCNRRAWSHPKPHNFREHPYLITAGEMVNRGIAATDIAAMSLATADDRDSALEQLGVARQRHRDDIMRQARGADFAPLALDGEVLSFTQLSQLESVTPLIEGFLAKGELGELIGEPGTAKTFIALGMANCIAAGRDWCGHPVPRPTSVLYVLAEGTSDIEVRAKAFCEQHKITADDIGDRFHLYPHPVQITDEGHIGEVRAYVQKHGIEMVVFDTKARCTVGVEENSATDQGRAIANVETINQECGAAVLLVHHTAKGSDTARGSTAWLGAVWTSLLVTRPTKDKKKASAVSITCAKHKGWPDGCTHKFTLASVTVSEDAMPGKTVIQRKSLAVVPVDAVAEADAQAKSDSEIGAKIKAVFHTYGATTGLTKAEARKHARDEEVTDSSYSRYFDMFVKSQVLVPMPGASAHYRLKSDATASTVGTEENQVLVDALKDRMCQLSAAGEITAAHTRTDVANMLGAPDKTAFSQAWGWFEDQERPTVRA